MIDQYLVKIDKGAAIMITRKSKDAHEDRNEHPVGKKGTRGFGAQSRKSMPATPGTSTGGGVAGIKNISIFKKKQTTLKKKETTLKKKKSPPILLLLRRKSLIFLNSKGGKMKEKRGF